MVHTTEEDRESEAERRMRENLERFLSQQQQQRQQQQQQRQHPLQQQQQQQTLQRQQHGLCRPLTTRTRLIMGSVTGRSVTFKCNY